jgi:hypothetical protein
VYTDLAEAEEAELFLSLNDVLSVNAFDKFRVAVNAGRPDEVDIDRVVRSENLTISRDKKPGGIGAVTTLRRVYARTGPETLRKVLQIIRDSYGDEAFEAVIIDGIGHLCQRYGKALDVDAAIQALHSASAGTTGLLQKAAAYRKSLGHSMAVCVAAAASEIINSKAARGRKLASWWAEAQEPAAQVARDRVHRSDARARA